MAFSRLPIQSWFRKQPRSSERGNVAGVNHFRTWLSLEPLDERVVPARFVPSDNPAPVVTGPGAWQASGTFRDTQQEFRGIFRLTTGTGSYDYEGQDIRMTIEPTGNEVIGTPITVRLTGHTESQDRRLQENTWASSYDPDGDGPAGYSDLLVGEAIGTDFFATNSVTFPSTIGGTFDISFKYTASGSTTPFFLRSALFYYQFATEAAPDVDVQPTQLDWDEVNGGVKLAYTNSAALPAPPDGKDWTYNLFWADSGGNKLGGAIPGGEQSLERGKGSHPAQITSLTKPPDTARNLLFVVNAGGLAGEVQANNTKVIAYDPRIESVTAKYDGTGTADTVFGRFFNGFPAIDQRYTIVLSKSVAALTPAVELNIGGRPFTATRQTDGVTYVTGAIDPGQFTGDPGVTVKASVGGGQQGSPWTGTLDTEPLPKWASKLTGTTLTWTPSGNGGIDYEIKGQLLDIKTPVLFADIPGGVWLGGGQPLTTQLTAQIGVKVGATLDPAAKPDVSATLDLSATFLGKDLFTPVQLTYPAGGSSGFQFTLNLDPKSLNVASGTVSYDSTGMALVPSAPIPLFDGKLFQIGLFQVKSALQLTPSLVLKASITLDTDLNITSASYVDATLTGTITGKLLELDLGSSTLISAFKRAKDAVDLLTLKGLIQKVIGAITPDLFRMDLNVAPGSNLTLKTRITLGGGTPTIQSASGSVKFAVTGSVYFIPANKKLFDLPADITDLLKLEKTWP